MTEDLDLADTVTCPHCGGVLLGRWEEHFGRCPAAGGSHACRACDEAMDDFAKGRL
jgi:hypothetical protein